MWNIKVNDLNLIYIKKNFYFIIIYIYKVINMKELNKYNTKINMYKQNIIINIYM